MTKEIEGDMEDILKGINERLESLDITVERLSSPEEERERRDFTILATILSVIGGLATGLIISIFVTGPGQSQNNLIFLLILSIMGILTLLTQLPKPKRELILKYKSKSSAYDEKEIKKAIKDKLKERISNDGYEIKDYTESKIGFFIPHKDWIQKIRCGNIIEVTVEERYIEIITDPTDEGGKIFEEFDKTIEYLAKEKKIFRIITPDSEDDKE